MTEILSKNEIDALLSALSTESKNVASPTARASSHKKVKVYDFRRPDKFSKDQMRALQMMHEVFARLTTTSISTQLRTLVSMHVTTVDQFTYEEFIRSIPNPTTLVVINMSPLRGSAILEIEPNIAYTIIDRLFGGSGDAFKIDRELSEIEKSVLENIIIRMLGNLRDTWSGVVDLRPRVGNLETNPQFVQIVPPNDMVVLLTLETRVGQIEGMINLCIPYITIEPIIAKLSAQYWYSSMRWNKLEENKSIIQDRLDEVKVSLEAEVGEIDLPLSDIISLAKDDVICLGKTPLSSDMTLKIGGRKKFHCKPGKIKNKKAVKLGEKIQSQSEDSLVSVKSAFGERE